MATYKAEHLQEMIRKVVRSEIKGVVADVIAEVLSERYLKQLAESTAAANAPRGANRLPVVGDDTSDEDNEVPLTLANTILGVGQDNPAYVKEPKGSRVKQFVKEDVNRNEMLSLFFEGTRPLKEVESKVEEGIQLPDPESSPELARWAELAKAADSLAEAKKPIAKNVEAEEARIKRMREQLEVKVG